MAVEHFKIVKFPIVTEKSNDAIAGNKYVFCVNKTSNKIEVKKAIENIYNVKVKDVNMVSMPRKKKKYKFRIEGYRPGYKKAIVTLKEGDTIAIT
ncbi:MAG TPA: 50S ribosomal protein L23 [bacterium]|nr:50S ribosomal protein L23 [bacterium]